MIDKLVRVVTWESDEETGAMCVLDIWEIQLSFRNNSQLSTKSKLKLLQLTTPFNDIEGVSCQMEVLE